jgi:hypothetical protein
MVEWWIRELENVLLTSRLFNYLLICKTYSDSVQEMSPECVRNIFSRRVFSEMRSEMHAVLQAKPFLNESCLNENIKFHESPSRDMLHANRQSERLTERNRRCAGLQTDLNRMPIFRHLLPSS